MFQASAVRAAAPATASSVGAHDVARRRSSHPARTSAPDAASTIASENEERGYRLAQAACSQCHSIEEFGLSPNAAAPEWPEIANTEGLTRDSLTTWLTDAHNYPGEMDFYLEADEIDQLVEYLLTLRREDYHPAYQ